MAAGLGFKTFNTGDVLSAADVNGYLMQGVLVFADATARDAAITSPQEGQFAYTKDNNSLWYYTGSAWAASGATGDIEGVTAGTGISGGGTSGTVTITNSMATAIDAKGDLIVGTGADTFSRLAVGATNGHILTVDSAEATGMKWAAAAGGGSGFTKITTLSPSAVASINADSVFSSTYTSYQIVGFIETTADANFEARLRNAGSTLTTSTYFQDSVSAQGAAGSAWYIKDNRGANNKVGFVLSLTNVANSLYKIGQVQSAHSASSGTYMANGFRNSTTSAHDGIRFETSAGNFTGEITIYGLAK